MTIQLITFRKSNVSPKILTPALITCSSCGANETIQSPPTEKSIYTSVLAFVHETSAPMALVNVEFSKRGVILGGYVPF